MMTVKTDFQSYVRNDIGMVSLLYYILANLSILVLMHQSGLSVRCKSIIGRGGSTGVGVGDASEILFFLITLIAILEIVFLIDKVTVDLSVFIVDVAESVDGSGVRKLFFEILLELILLLLYLNSTVFTLQQHIQHLSSPKPQ